MPVHVGDSVTAKCEVTDRRDDKPIVTLAPECKRDDGEIVMTGTAAVYINPHPVD